MKVTFRNILIALAAIISLTACSDDDYKTPVENDFVGSWEVSYADKNLQTDGLLIYMFNANRTCLIENWNFLAKPEEQKHEFHGYWSFSNPILTITYYHEDPMTGDDYEKTIHLTIKNLSGSRFHATSENISQEKIFTRMKSFAY